MRHPEHLWARLCLACWLLLLAATASAQGGAARTPLLMPGKKALYQRVLTRPGAALASSPGGAAQGAIPAFTRYYVYDRKTISGAEWLEVGADSYGAVKGWLEAGQVVPWRQQLALAFTPPGMRQPVLFFRDRKPLADILDQQDPASQAAAIRKALASQGHEPRIVAVEPPTSVDINKKFYLLPILEAEEVYSAKGPTVRLLEVASVAGDTAKGTGAADGQGQQTALKTFSAAVVFVIDSTISMGPYIERTREAVRRIYAKVEAAHLENQVRFGLVAFRGPGKNGKPIEYTARMFADPGKVKNGQDFLARVAALKEAPASTAHFDEDSYAGVMTALRDVNWFDYGGRFIILVTDAGALSANEPGSSTGLDAREVRLEAKHRGVALYTLHLKTPEGEKDHAKAQGQYEELSANDLLKNPLYFGVDSGSVENFGSIVDALGEAIADQVMAASRGETVVGSARTADPAYVRQARETRPRDPVAQARQQAALLGYAMKLAYLGSKEGVTAPGVFEAWIADRDFDDLTRPTTEVRVLLTKNELSNLQAAVKEVADAALKGMTSPDTFFQQISLAAARFSRDPEAAKGKKGAKLADLGLLGEYMDGLPYRSDILNLDQDAWRAMSAGEQEALIRSLNRKLRLYQIYNADNDRWVKLAEGGDPKDDVYPVPLEAMP